MMTIGICAHVDAGKTTLSEQLLFHTGAIRKTGRVDHGDAFLDTNIMERERGITIFAKQARFTLADLDITLLDTPGHADFTPETERILQVLDLAILVISASDGVTGQVRTLWSLLGHYHVPVFVFVNKMDMPGAEERRRQILEELQSLSGSMLDFTDPDSTDFQESVACLDEALMHRYLEGDPITPADIQLLVEKKELVPVFFGSALKDTGIDAFLKGLSAYAPNPDRSDRFGARVFKITRDSAGNRVSWMKLTGGSLKVRTELLPGEKADELRLYHGEKYDTVQEVTAGTVAAVIGLSSTRIGMLLGSAADTHPGDEGHGESLIQPIMTCQVLLADDQDPYRIYEYFRTLEEEEPLLHVLREQDGSIHVRVCGAIELEILQRIMADRFGATVSFGPSKVVYMETIAAPVEGVGHFEPLRHYAEVHLLLDPLPAGSGMVYEAAVSTDDLALNWQRLVLSELESVSHPGILTGAALTDMKVTLIAGKAHIKHTEGGDFRQASYRAIRQGLCMGESILLEPFLRYRLTLPLANVGRAMHDLQMLFSTDMQQETTEGDTTILTGLAPAACLDGYAQTVLSYTGGLGRLDTTFDSYRPCHNAEEVIAESGYDPDADLSRPAASVFCSHGAGTVIPWDQVRNYMHIDTGWKPGISAEELSERDPDEDLHIAAAKAFRAGEARRQREEAVDFETRENSIRATENELKAIFERTYGPTKVRTSKDAEEARDYDAPEKTPGISDPKYEARKKKTPAEIQFLLVDGYNILYASEELKDLAARDLKAARDRLIDEVANFQGMRREKIILVFDAYRVAGGREHIEEHSGLTIVYTKEAETADQYIEKAAHTLARHDRVTVATSDAVEQIIIYDIAQRMSARDFWETVERSLQDLRERYLERRTPSVGNKLPL